MAVEVEVAEGRQVKNNGVLYKAGELIHDLSDEVKKRLVALGAVVDKEAPQVDEQVKQDARTVVGQVETDVDALKRDNVGGQINAQATADVKAALDTLKAPGTQVTPSGQPTNEEVAATAAGVQ